MSSPNLEVQERASTALQASNLFLLLFFRFFIEDLRACFPMSDKSDSDLAHLENGHTLRIFDIGICEQRKHVRTLQYIANPVVR